VYHRPCLVPKDPHSPSPCCLSLCLPHWKNFPVLIRTLVRARLPRACSEVLSLPVLSLTVSPSLEELPRADPHVLVRARLPRACSEVQRCKSCESCY
jgi:hypothetical protein